MTGLSKVVLGAITRLQVLFHDDLGNTKQISATGFWLTRRNGDAVLVTNRHNLDPTLKLGVGTGFKLGSIEIELRRTAPAGKWYAETKLYRILDCTSLKLSESADCGILLKPTFENGSEEFSVPYYLSEEQLADDQFFTEHVDIMDPTSFIGFAGDRGKVWWDEQFRLPIARHATIASLPGISFSNSAIKTSDVLLVSGFSFSGSSGSPIFSHQKGFPSTSSIQWSYYVEPRVLGIMTGHTNFDEKPNGFLMHAGLSYFTRSTSILKLLL